MYNIIQVEFQVIRTLQLTISNGFHCKHVQTAWLSTLYDL